MIENLVSRIISGNLLWKALFLQRKPTKAMVNDLELLISYAESNPFHYSALKMVYDNRVKYFDDNNWDMLKYYNRL